MKILFVLGSGGHTKRGLLLSKQIGKVEKFYIVPWESELTKQKVGDNYFSVISPRFKAKDNLIMTILRTLFLFIHSLIILCIVRPNVIVSLGSGITIPPFLMAKFLRIKTLFIESPSRVYEPSIAGKFLMNKVDMWLSSWPEITKKYKDVKYRGLIT